MRRFSTWGSSTSASLEKTDLIYNESITKEIYVFQKKQHKQLLDVVFSAI
jgi:hypothetical protein